MSMQAEISGYKALGNLLRQFPDRIQRDVVNSVAARGATVIKNRAKQNLRANGSVETGTLLRSLRTRKKRGTHGVYLVYADRSSPHASLVEFGTGPRKLKKPIPYEIKPGEWITLSHTGQAPAKPFFRPAMDEEPDEILKEMMIRMAKRMEKEAAKMAQQYGTMSKSYRRKLAK